ncbi:ABC transporter transmembrane domain-containing protein [Demequina sp. B12]|uniref:ABC transporter ATP-binding protein/permease n=1 Tax=Demequina sp. B12 TaxID=2992757 RepID=UPI00237A4402|nr:ABC transporter transmembrane domain-containing protein [Demequina sp. B12]MDE0572783.1 ABC transporter transmembrane domain-containing protein [Demequina sp. B12]
MRPLDPRLAGRIGPARRYIVTTALLGFFTALLIGVQALVLARVLAPVLAPGPLTDDGLGPLGFVVPLEARQLSVALAWLILVVGLRVVVTWVQERLAHRAGAQVIAELREQVVSHATALGPRWIASGEGTAVATTVTRGLESLMPYFVRYLPQLLLSVTVTPVMMVVVLGLDWISALIVIGTVPLIPIFMILIGLVTRERSAKHLDAMQRLASRTLDLIEGLPTLRALGRERGPAARVRELGDAQRRATMGSLRIAFMSGMALELLTTLSVALVAVTLGFRLVDGNVSIETALAVLILAPEVYLPLRMVGTHFHASADGLAAADAAFEVLEIPVEDSTGKPAAPSLHGASLVIEDLSVATPDGRRLAPARLNTVIRPGTVTALVGPNGDGKSTALASLMGLLPADSGFVAALTEHGRTDTIDVDLATWSTQFAWAPQRPDLGPEGRTLSLGQRQRVALDRAFASARPVLVLDEPTSHLDRAHRDQVITRIVAAAQSGTTVVVATHEPELIAAADVVVDVTAMEVAR